MKSLQKYFKNFLNLRLARKLKDGKLNLIYVSTKCVNQSSRPKSSFRKIENSMLIYAFIETREKQLQKFRAFS